MAAHCYPSFHHSMPWVLRLLAVVAVLSTRSTTFSITHLHVLFPFAVAGFVLFMVYAGPFFFSRSHHKQFMPHLTCVVLAFFTYSNSVLVAVQLEISVAPLASLLCSLHLLYWVYETLGRAKYLFSTIEISRSFLLLAMMTLLLAGNIYIPRTVPSSHALLSVLFFPEILGTLVRCVFWGRDDEE